MVANSIMEKTSYGLGTIADRVTTEISILFLDELLWREIPIAWGTTIDNLTPEINHFKYASEAKYLTLKDIDLYLIPDG